MIHCVYHIVLTHEFFDECSVCWNRSINCYPHFIERFYSRYDNINFFFSKKSVFTSVWP